MKRNFTLKYLLLLFVLNISYNSFANKVKELSSDSTQLVLISATLNDDTKIWGKLITDNKEQFTVMDFNAGELTILKSAVKNSETKKIESDVIIETTSGTTYFGKIIAIEKNIVKIKSSLIGEFEIASNTISKITFSNAFVNRRGGNWFVNPNATRYFFAPSSIPLKKKEGYFQNAYLLANSASFGITDNITVGGGVVIPLLFYVTPKVSFKVAKNLYLGAGVLFTQSFIQGFNLSAGIAYGLITYGNLEHSVTIGSGYGFAKFNVDNATTNKYKETKMPIVTINGMTRIAKKLSIVTENWLIPRSGYNKEVDAIDPDGNPYVNSVWQSENFYTLAGSAGVRIMPGIKTSIDFAVVGIKANPKDNYLLLPYLDFVYKFN